MIEEMPPPCTKLVFCRYSHGIQTSYSYGHIVDEAVHCAGHPGCVREFTLPMSNNFDCTHWAELPAEDDPRWIAYDRTRNDGYPRWEQRVLCLARQWVNHRATYPVDHDFNKLIQYVHAPIGEGPHFPGFLGGPHTRDWGIQKWMPLYLLDSGLKAVPAAFLAKMTPFQWHRKNREIDIEHESENIFLSVINDGHCYKTWMQKFCHMGPRWIVELEDNAGRILRLQKGFGEATQKAINYLVGRNELERDMSVWHDALARARFKIARYYQNHAKELLTCQMSK